MTMNSDPSLPVRQVVVIIGTLECVIWLLACLNGIFSGVSLEAKGINKDVAIGATWAFLATGAPALVLAYFNRALWIALLLALAPFLGLFALMLSIAI